MRRLKFVLILWGLILFTFLTQSAWAASIFTVSGSITDENNTLAPDGMTVVVENLSRSLAGETTTKDGKYAVAFVDFNGNSVAEVGDPITVTVTDASGTVFAHRSYQIQPGDVNTRTAIVNVGASDLRITQLTANPPSPFNVGQEISLRVEVANSGLGDSPSTLVGFYLGKTQTDVSNKLGEKSIQIVVVGKAESIEFKHTFQPEQVGKWFLIARVDEGNQIRETNEANNLFSIAVEIVSPPKPDLQISAIEPDTPVPFKVGQNVNWTITVINTGTKEAPGSQLGIYLGQTANDISNQVGTVNSVPEIHLGPGVKVAFAYTFKPGDAGLKYLIAKADDGNKIPELVEENNQKHFGPFMIESRPDLVVESISPDNGTYQEGKTVTWTISIKNIGANDTPESRFGVFLGRDVTDQSNPIGTGTVSSIPAGESRPVTMARAFQNSDVGMRFLIVTADLDHKIEEVDEGNNTKVSQPITIESRTNLKAIRILPSRSQPFRVGDTIQWTIDIENTGTLETSGSQLMFYLGMSSEDTSNPIGSQTLPTIQPRKIASVVYTYTFKPADASLKRENQYFIAKADALEQIAETDEGDNLAGWGPFIVLPDVNVKIASIQPTSVTPFIVGQAVEWEIRVENTGSMRVPEGIPLEFYLGRSDSDTNHPIGTQTLTMPIPASGTVKIPQPFSYTFQPSDASSTKDDVKYLLVMVDKGNGVDETDESDNLNHSNSFLVVPDVNLRVTRVEPNLTPPFSVGQEVVWKITIENKGSVNAGECVLGLYLGKSRSDRSYRIDGIKVGAIQAGKSVEIARTYRFKASDAGESRFLVAVADEEEQLLETDEEDNLSSSNPFRVLGPDLRVVSINPIPAPPFTIGQTITFQITVENVGTERADASELGVYLAKDETDVDPNQPLGTISIPLLEVGRKEEVKYPYQLKSADMDKRVLIAVADYNNQLEETKEDNNRRSFPFSVKLQGDVNGDGTVDIFDLRLVGGRFNEKVIYPRDPTEPNPDVNGDGIVNILDLVLVGANFDKKREAPAAPIAPIHQTDLQIRLSEVEKQGYSNAQRHALRQALVDLEAMADAPGVEIARRFLQAWLAQRKPPVTETKLLPNYPNPFNPETWMPFQLASPAWVTIQIYSASGQLIREVSLGQLPAGSYVDRGRAAYWDGRTHSGEVAASGIYFYRLRAGNFEQTRKMLLRK